ncbi:pleiotropic drug resistance protein 3-like protein [Carex littledalei]|uniref:Pleiotropic drug resistance protein 3-like protein n=1 Tax=Carex littledalei TaxID=544730 RepID=A0A833QND9_9POAL|nr:pleiotropic drug resistance protein 3-like protein [Carex littledalei]
MDMEGEIQRIGSLNRSLRHRSRSQSLSRQPSIVAKIKLTAFSSSTRSSSSLRRLTYEAENDEEALMWAALERLPTYARVRTGILNMSEGQQREVDIKCLGIIEKKALLDRLLNNAEEENERFLMKLRRRIDRAGIDMPTVEVRYNNLKIDADIYVGTRGLPTLSNTFINYFVPIGTALNLVQDNKKELTITQSISGIIKPRRLTLLLGPPGAGKTTLLKALAGQSDKNLKIQGSITYNGHTMNEFVPQRTASYISQHDIHLGELTVRETLAFSARCQGAGTRYELLSELSRKEKEQSIHPDPDIDVFMKSIGTEGKEANIITDYVLKLLGLENCADTIVGNQLMRGVSGGEKKRVTIGEMLVGSANVFLMDEISTGLDSSTTFNIVNCIRQYNHIFGTTTVISLLQPSPETYELFDDVILISEGQIVYQGPREYVLEFFESTGFKCPVRKGVADFLQEVTSLKDQQQYWMRDTPYRYVSVNAFAEAFHSFHVGRNLEQELSVTFDKSKGHRAALTTQKYGVNNKELFRACFDRQILLMKRNMPIYIFKIVELAFLTLVTMTVFFHTKLHRRDLTDGSIYMGALFLAITTIMFNGLAELGMTIFNLPVFYKQRGNRFYPPWAYCLPAWFLQIPISILDAAVWVFLSYYVIGFDPNFSRMLKQFFLLIGVNQMASGLFRLVAGIGRDLTIAMTYGAGGIIFFVVLGGFIISRNDIKGLWILGYWMSPLAYAQNALSVNEFFGHKWNKHVAGTNEPLGHVVLKARGVFVESNWFWLGFFALLGFTVLYNFLFTLTLTYLDAYGSEQPTISDEILRDKHMYLTGEGSEALHRENNVKRNDSARNNVARNGSQRERGMVLPFTPLCVTFEDVKYSVDMPPLFLLRKGGQEIFFGPLGHNSCHLVEYLEAIRGIKKIRDGYNPATWMMEVTSKSQEELLHLDFNDIYKKSELYQGSIQDLFNVMGSMYASCVFLGVKNSSSIQPIVDFERSVFYRERAAGMYSPLPYALGFVGIEIPYNFIQSVMYGITVYVLCDYKWTAYKFFWFWFVMFFTFLYHTLFGMMSVAMSPNFHIAAVVAAGNYSLWNIFSGFVIPRPQFLRSYYGFKRSFMPVVGVVIVGFTVSFALLFGYALKKLNWQKR